MPLNNTLKLLIILFVISISIASYCSMLIAGNGGPDRFGYTWKDSYEIDGPVYKWYEIPSNTDEVVTGLGDDNVIGPFPIGGKFIFYWYPVDKFWVGANGYISFDNVNIAAPFPYILPDSTTQKYNFIAPMMSDLIFAGRGNKARCLYHITNDSLIVSYIKVPFWSPINTQFNQSGLNSFQAIFNRLDNSITFNYQLQQGTSYSNLTIGIENMTGTMGLQFDQNSYPIDGYTIKFYYPQNPSYVITDGGIKWNTADGTKGLFLPFPYNNFPLITDVTNFGNQDIPSYTVSEQIQDPLGTITSFSRININNMLYGSYDTLITFPKTFSPQITGTHTFSTSLTGVSNDKFSSDNNLTQEIIVIDTSQTIMNLTFAKGQPGGSLIWNGGNGGAGVYFVPPVYPAKLESTNFVIGTNFNNEAFYAEIFDDKGLNGMPGHLIDSVLVTSGKIQVGHKTVVPVSKDIIIYSGGVYVAWLMKGQYIGLGIDYNGPFSRQTFENLSGTFAQYRDSQNQDFFIGLNISKHSIEDIGVSSIISPSKNENIKHPVTVSCRIKNYGQSSLSNFSVYYSMDYGKQIIEKYAGDSLKPGDSLLFTFKTPLFTDLDSVVGYLCTGTIMLNDFNHKNDSVCEYVKIYNITGVNQFSILNSQFSILPNPFSESTVIKFSKELMLNSEHLTLTLYDIMGKEVRKIENGEWKIENGFYYITINRDNLLPGIYFCRISTINYQFSAKLIIISN